MTIMPNANRLIDDFKKLDQTTIWKHLNAMSVSYSVYSSHLNGLSPFLTEYDVYLYCNFTNMVVVCLDCCGRGEDQTYNESETLSPLILTDGEEPRVSIVWKLAQTVRVIKNKLMMPVLGVLLTEADILNAYELYELWDANNIVVIDHLKRIKYRKIRVNDDAELACKSYVDVLTIEESADDDDMESEDSEDLSDDDTIFPDGEVEQNQSLSVKVDILRPIANPRLELDRLVGCAEIKQRMDELVSLASYNKILHDLYPTGKQHKVSLHSLFLGRPGTGKTTVCKIYGSLLRHAGALSKGHVVVCDRSTFIGTLWGDEERSTHQVLDMAKGGVLMIDEAYLLNSSNANDPGKLVIQLLMNALADETQRDIAIVLCGYKEPMQKLLDLNPGLQSRFPNKFEFQDFTVEELLEITKRRVKEYNYEFTDDAWEKYVHMLSLTYQKRDPQTWGNARFIGNQLERIYIQHASRCVKQQPMKKSALLLLTPEDIVPIEIPRPKARIGF